VLAVLAEAQAAAGAVADAIHTFERALALPGASADEELARAMRVRRDELLRAAGGRAP
jgi:hypothetical protein